jgi:hypothetical protein
VAEVVRGWIVSQRPPKGRPDFCVPDEVIYAAAEALQEGWLPLQLDDDDRICVPATVIAAEVREVEPGILGIWAEYEVPDGAVKGRTGLSISYGTVHDSRTAEVESSETVRLFADAANYSTDEMAAAAEAMAVAVNVEFGPLYQFHLVEPSKVILELAWDVVEDAETVAGLISGVRKLLTVDAPTLTDIRFDVVDTMIGRTTRALVRTNSPDVAASAIESLYKLTERPPLAEFDTAWGAWWTHPEEELGEDSRHIHVHRPERAIGDEGVVTEMSDDADPFTRLRLEAGRTLFWLHGWRRPDGSVGSDYAKQAQSLSEAIADLEANECCADVGGYFVSDAFVVMEEGEPEVHVELVTPNEIMDASNEDWFEEPPV